MWDVITTIGAGLWWIVRNSIGRLVVWLSVRWMRWIMRRPWWSP